MPTKHKLPEIINFDTLKTITALIANSYFYSKNSREYFEYT
jgi:hypothetical protein